MHITCTYAQLQAFVDAGTVLIYQADSGDLVLNAAAPNSGVSRLYTLSDTPSESAFTSHFTEASRVGSIRL